MTAPPCTTDGCDGFCHDQAWICPRCVRKLERYLGDLPALMVELEITATRQSRISDRSGPRSKRSEVYWRRAGATGDTHDDLATSMEALARSPFNWKASDDLYAARNALTSWVRILVDEGAELLGPVPVGPICWSRPRCTHMTCWQVRTHEMLDEAALCLWLLRQLDWFRSRREATEFYDDIKHLHGAILRAIDRSVPLIFAGSCTTCKTVEPDGTVLKINLYARLGANTVRCHKCGSEYDTAARRDQMLTDAWGMLFNSAGIALAAASFGYELKGERIRKWKQRGLITPRGMDADGNPTYRLGDIFDKLHADQARRDAKAGAA